LGTDVLPTVGATFSNWRDKSGQANHAVNPVGQTVTYSNNSLFFPGTTFLNFTNPNALVANRPFTIFVVEKRQSSSNNTYLFSGTSQLLRQNLHFGYRFQTIFTLALYSDDQDITVPAYTNPTTEPYRIWSANLNTSFLGAIFLNGSLQGTKQYGGYLTAWTGGGIANCNSSLAFGNQTSYTGFIQEILFYSNALTTAQQQQVEGYLAWKWGLTGSLPFTHPNAFMPPS
jgi:hypothetical protein